jgi:hypothetical protein
MRHRLLWVGCVLVSLFAVVWVGCVTDESSAPLVLTDDSGADGGGATTTTDGASAIDSSIPQTNDSGGGAIDASSDSSDAGPTLPPADGGLLYVLHAYETNTSPPYTYAAYDPAGNVVVGFQFNQPTSLGDASIQPDAGGQDIGIAKLDHAGNTIWLGSFGGPGEDDIDGLAADDNGDIYVSGRFNGATFDTLTHRGNGQYDGFVMRLSGVDGHFIDAVDLVAAGAGAANYVAVAAKGGNVVVAAAIQGTASVRNNVGVEVNRTSVAASGKNGAFVTMLDGATLDEKWSLSIGGDDNTVPHQPAIGANGSVYIGGTFAASTLTATMNAITLPRKSDTFTDGFAAHLTSAGIPIFAVGFGAVSGATNNATVSGVTAAPNGDAYIVGSVQGTIPIGKQTLMSAGKNDAFVARLDANTGATVWARSFGGAENESALAVAPDPSGGAFVGGTFGSASVTFDSKTLANQFPPFAQLFTARVAPTGPILWAFGITTTTSSAFTQVSGVASSLDAGVAVFTGSFKGNMNLGDGNPVQSGLGGGGYDMFAVQRVR